MLRRMSNTPFALLALVLAVPVCGQVLQPAGTVQRLSSPAFTRGLLGNNPGEMLQRFDADDLTGFGIEAAHPGQQVVRGVVVVISGALSQVTVSIYSEDPARPGFPDIANPRASVSGVSVPLPIYPTYAYFNPPALLPPGQDVFVGVTVGPASSPIAGQTLAIMGSNPLATYHDVPGAGMPSSPPEANSYVLYRDGATNTLTYGSRGQFILDLLTTLPRGMPCAITNQTGYAQSNSPPGGTSMLSGLHPDAASPPQNAGRADDVGFLFADQTLPVGSPVFFFGSFTGFGPHVPIDSILPGSAGVVCLDANWFLLGVTFLDTTHSTAWVTTIHAADRSNLPTQWAQQAIGWDMATGILRSTQCGMQRF